VDGKLPPGSGAGLVEGSTPARVEGVADPDGVAGPGGDAAGAGVGPAGAGASTVGEGVGAGGTAGVVAGGTTTGGTATGGTTTGGTATGGTGFDGTGFDGTGTGVGGSTGVTTGGGGVRSPTASAIHTKSADALVPCPALSLETLKCSRTDTVPSPSGRVRRGSAVCAVPCRELRSLSDPE
jgi:hypothetical protein